MPFKSKAQMGKCFATKGFGGKVDCSSWVKKYGVPKTNKKRKR